MRIIIILLIFVFLLLFWLVGYVKKLHELIDMQTEIYEKIGDYICDNKN